MRPQVDEVPNSGECAMAKCVQCNTELPSDASFCPQCARPVSVLAGATMAAGRLAALTGTLSGTETMTPAVDRQKPPPGLAAGERFHGRYTIERPLGAGAMGTVYVAKDDVTKDTVALKLINPVLADRPSARERFVQEGRMAREVRHPNVVAMYDVGDADGQVYLVMQYLDGETLRKWLHRTLQEGRDVSFDTARGIVRKILEGLAAAHATGVVHRDLKPENVMLAGDPHKGDYGLKILDFGIARAVGAASHLTTTSSSTGTPLYMAPEQKTAADTVGPPADLYAVTAILYELLLGVAPEGRWNAPSRERTDLPAGIDAVIETGLANRPRSRYQSAQDYMKALDEVGKPLAPPPPPPPPASPEPPGKTSLDKLKSSSDWLKTHSPGWKLWDRMSTTERYIFSAIGIVAVIAMIAYSARGGGGENAQPPVSIGGRWADEVTGTGVAVGWVDLVQQGTAVSGIIYNTAGYQVGTFNGQVQGNVLDYSYVAASGMTGTGRGQATADGNHMDVEVQDNATGQRQRHTLHRNHMPPQ